MTSAKTISYKDAGVDIIEADLAIKNLKPSHARKENILGQKNGFAGMFSLRSFNHMKEPVLVSGTDGVGTKLLVAIEANNFNSLGQDLVAMCANDILTCGAEPIFFLDYFATAKLKDVCFTDVVNGIVDACEKINCALIGGETAELPSMYKSGHFDLAGFVVGVVDKPKLISSSLINNGNVLIGLASSGLHSNGFSLARKIIFEKLGLKINDKLWSNQTVAKELLKPTKLYVKQIQYLLQNNISISGMAHITGGGISENVPRFLPEGLSARINKNSFPIPKIFSYLQENGPVNEAEMFKTFNMGLGMIIAVKKQHADEALALLKQKEQAAFLIGDICEGNRQVLWK